MHVSIVYCDNKSPQYYTPYYNNIMFLFMITNITGIIIALINLLFNFFNLGDTFKRLVHKTIVSTAHIVYFLYLQMKNRNINDTKIFFSKLLKYGDFKM